MNGPSEIMLAGITAAAVWYADDRARQRAEVELRGRQVNREANAALHDAETHLKDLRDPLVVNLPTPVSLTGGTPTGAVRNNGPRNFLRR
jgi:hypothetical protein